MANHETYVGVGRPEDEKKKTTVERLIDAARRVVNRLKDERPEPDPKHAKFSKDVGKLMQKPPTRRELIQAEKREGIEHKPQIIPVKRAEGKQFSENLQKQIDAAKKTKKSPRAIEILEADPPHDQRAERVAARLLEIDETAPKSERQQKVREVAEDLWRLRVGSGYTNEGAEDARNYLWKMYGKYTSDKDFTPAEKDQLKREFTELLKTSKYPPDIVVSDQITNQLGGFEAKAKKRIDETNRRYSDIISERPLTYDDPPSDVNIENFEEDLKQLETDWSDYAKDEKQAHKGNPPENEEIAYRRLQKEFQDRLYAEREQQRLQEEQRRQEQKAIEDQIRRHEQQQDRERYEEEQIPNTISLSKREAQDLINDPIGTIDTKLQDIEAGVREYTQQGFQPEADIGRLRLLTNYFLMDEFAEHRFDKLQIEIEGDEDGSLLQRLITKREEIQAGTDLLTTEPSYIKEIKKQRGRYVKEFTARFHAIQFLEAKSRAGGFNDERLLGTVAKGMTENDFVELLSIYGGLVEDASDALSHNAIGLIRNGHGVDGRINDVVKEKAIRKTIDWMKKNPELFKDTYDKYIQGYYTSDETNAPAALLAPINGIRKAKSYDDAVTAIVNLAAIQKDMVLDWDSLEIRGLSPLADAMYGSGDPRYRSKGSMGAANKRYLKFSFEQWDSLEARYKYDRMYNRQIALFYAHQYKHEVDHEAQHDMSHFLEELSHTPTSGPAYEKMKKKIQYMHFWNPDLYEFNDRDWDHYIDKMRKGKANKELLEEFKVRIGIDIADSHGTRGFFPLESGWRKDSVKTSIDKLLTEYFGEKEINKLFTARRLTDAADAYATQKLKHHHAHHEEEFLKLTIAGGKDHHDHDVIGVAQLRPHDFANMMLEKGDSLFLDWYHEHGLGPAELGKDANEKLTQLGMIVSTVNRKLFRGVMDLTDAKEVKKYVPIDFSAVFTSWTGAQREAFTDVVSKIKVKDSNDNWITPLAGKEQQVADAMRGLYGFVSSEKALNRFTSIKYEDVIAASGPRWQDDLPMTLLQKPDRMKFLTDEKRRELVPFGDYISGKGLAEGSGVFKRTYTDNASLERGNKLRGTMPGLNDQDFKKGGHDYYQAVGPTAGSFAGAVAYQEQEYAHSKMKSLTPEAARRAALFRPLGYNATLARKYSGNQGDDVMWPEEAHHFQEEMFQQTVNALDEVPALMHTKEELLRVATWDKIIGGEDGPVAKMIKMRFGEVEGIRKYHEFTHFLNDMYPNLILRDKLLKVGLAGVVLTGLFLFYQAFSTGVGEAQAASHGGGGH